MVEYSSRAYSSSVECIHGMDEGGVQFPVGPQLRIFPKSYPNRTI